MAAANYTQVNASNWVVVTPQGGTYGTIDGSQEYITQVNITQVNPEPATLLLLGTGLMIMLFGAGTLRRLTA